MKGQQSRKVCVFMTCEDEMQNIIDQVKKYYDFEITFLTTTKTVSFLTPLIATLKKIAPF